MALYLLPTITEQRFADYISANYTGYPVINAFSIADYSTPAVMVKVGKLSELEPFTHVYEAKLVVVVFSQIDDVADALTVHDNNTASIYDIMSNQTALMSFVNADGNRFHLHGYHLTGIDQERQERNLVSLFEYSVQVQTLSI